MILGGGVVESVPIRTVVSQMQARTKIKERLPEYFRTKGIIYPPTENLEQCSSAKTAAIKVRLLSEVVSKSGTLVDLTGGFGVDSFHFARRFTRVIYVEKDLNLLEVARHNHHILGVTNIEYVHSTAEEFLQRTSERFDVMYIDPSRRPAPGKKVITLASSTPDVVALQDAILSRSGFMLIKAAPLLDLSLGLRAVKNVTKAMVVAVQNDCKELLFLSSRTDESSDPPLITALNIGTLAEEKFDFLQQDELSAVPSFAQPKQFLFEPNAAIMKSGAFKLAGNRFGIEKLDTHSHIYTSTQDVEGFPGRVFKVKAVIPADAKLVRAELPSGRANLIVRNFPTDVASLKKKLKIDEGGDGYLIATTAMSRKIVIIADRLR